MTTGRPRREGMNQIQSFEFAGGLTFHTLPPRRALDLPVLPLLADARRPRKPSWRHYAPPAAVSWRGPKGASLFRKEGTTMARNHPRTNTLQ
jgi:hypothetical protein